MKRILALLALVPFLLAQDYNVPFRPRAAGGSQSQILPNWTEDDLPVSATTVWLPIVGSNETASEATGQFVMPHDTDFVAIRLQLSGDIGTAGDNATLTLREGGADTALACTISGGAGSETSCTASGTVTVEAGNLVALSLVTEGTPDASREVRYALKLTENTTNGRSSVWGRYSNIGASQTYYATVSGLSPNSTTEANNRTVVPIAGTLGNLRVNMSAAPGGTSRTFTLYQNGSPTAVSCVITAAATVCNDTDTVSIAAGDRITLEDVPAGTPGTGTQTRFAMTFDASASKFVVLSRITTDSLRGSGDDYSAVACGDCLALAWFGAANGRLAVSEAFTMTDLAAYSEDAGPYTVNVIPTVGGSDQTDITCSVSAGTTCNDAGSVAVSAGQTLEYHWSVTTGGGQWAYGFAGTVP